ncbi:VWA domain-containing protein [Chitinophagaceae bacterium MMS25-I14]
MLRFQHTYHLLALGLVPLLVALFVAMLLWRRARLKKLGEERLVNEQMRGFIPGRNTFRFVLLCIAFTAMVFGWANLQMGGKTDKVQRKGVDVMVALDVSKSMLAKDMQPDRLTRAKQLIMRMLDKAENDRVGLVVFAGRSYLQVPLTVDYSAMKMMLQTVTPALIPTQGTVIGDAIDMSMKSFSQKEKKFKSLIIISDGEDHDEQALSKAKEAADNGIIIHTVGIGSPQGTTIYDPETKTVKLDEQGNPVVSKLNEAELQNIAAAGHGTYTLLNNTDDAASKLIGEIDGMEQRNLGAVVFTDYTNYFQYFLITAFILLVAEWLLPAAKNNKKTMVA